MPVIRESDLPASSGVFSFVNRSFDPDADSDCVRSRLRLTLRISWAVMSPAFPSISAPLQEMLPRGDDQQKQWHVRSPLMLSPGDLTRGRIHVIRKLVLTIALSAVACTTAFAQNPPFANGTFCTQGKGFYSNNVQAAIELQSVNDNFPGQFAPRAAGSAGNVYSWNPTGTLVNIGKGVAIDSAFVDLRQALGANGQPGAFSMNATNPTDMGTGEPLPRREWHWA